MAKSGVLQIKILGDARHFNRTMDGLSGRLKSFAKAGAAAGVALAAGLGVAAIKAVGDAAELNETLSKTDQVFKDSSKTVRRFADQMAEDFGLVKNVTLDAASNIGLVAKAAGLTESAAAGMSVEMAQLSADASSFFNVPLDLALEKIRSGLVGEAEPLRQFGVLLSAARVEAKALELGLVGANGEISEGAKVQARAAIILEDMTDAAGDLDRTQGSLSNRVRELKGRFENFRTEIGIKLMPIADRLIAWADRHAPAAFATLEGWVDRIMAAFDENGLGGALSELGDSWSRTWESKVKPLFENTILPWFENTLLPRLTEWIIETAAPAIGEAAVDIGIALIKGVARGAARAVDDMPGWLRTILLGGSGVAINIVDTVRDMTGGGEPAASSSPAPSTGSFQLGRFHDGGVVPGRMGQEVPALLMAGETVLPTHKRSAGNSYTVNYYGGPDGSDPYYELRKLALVVG